MLPYNLINAILATWYRKKLLKWRLGQVWQGDLRLPSVSATMASTSVSSGLQPRCLRASPRSDTSMLPLSPESNLANSFLYSMHRVHMISEYSFVQAQCSLYTSGLLVHCCSGPLQRNNCNIRYMGIDLILIFGTSEWFRRHCGEDMGKSISSPSSGGSRICKRGAKVERRVAESGMREYRGGVWLWGRGLRKGHCTLPRKFFDFESENGDF